MPPALSVAASACSRRKYSGNAACARYAWNGLEGAAADDFSRAPRSEKPRCAEFWPEFEYRDGSPFADQLAFLRVESTSRSVVEGGMRAGHERRRWLSWPLVAATTVAGVLITLNIDRVGAQSAAALYGQWTTLPYSMPINPIHI